MPAQKTLVQRQYETLDFLRTYIREHQRPPTTEEMVIALGCHRTTVFVYLMQLEVGGYISKTMRRLDTIQVTPAGWEYEYQPQPRPTGYHRKPRVKTYHKIGGTEAERIERIYQREAAKGNIGWATLAPARR